MEFSYSNRIIDQTIEMHLYVVSIIILWSYFLQE